MVRRYEEPIEVRAGVGHEATAGGGLAPHFHTVEYRHGKEAAAPAATGSTLPADLGVAGSPEAFMWRGRHYAVRRVLDHWQERRAWWRDALEARPQPAGVLGGTRERRVWRVEASAGRLAGTGVYDLAADPDTRQWRLLRVAD